MTIELNPVELTSIEFMQIQLTQDNERLIEQYASAMKQGNATYTASPTSIVNVFFAEVIAAKIKKLERTGLIPKSK